MFEVVSVLWPIPNSCSRSHEKLFSIIWTATVRDGNKSFTHIEHRVSVVGPMGLVLLISVLSPEYLLPPLWVPVLSPIYFRERPAKWSCYIQIWLKTYPICEGPFSRSAQRSFPSSQESRRNHRCGVWTEVAEKKTSRYNLTIAVESESLFCF